MNGLRASSPWAIDMRSVIMTGWSGSRTFESAYIILSSASPDEWLYGISMARSAATWAEFGARIVSEDLPPEFPVEVEIREAGQRTSCTRQERIG